MMDAEDKAGSRRWLVRLGLLLMTAALYLTIRNLSESLRAGEASMAAVKALVPIIEEAKDREAVYEEQMLSQVIPDYVLDPARSMPEENIDGHKYIGVLWIPDISAALSVMSGWSYPDLKISPCRYAGSAYSDDLVICAHNYDTHFGNLKYLNIGSEIYFTDVEGHEFRYEVGDMEVLEPTAIEDMVSGEWDLTLFTCTIGGAKRVTIRCLKV